MEIHFSIETTGPNIFNVNFQTFKNQTLYLLLYALQQQTASYILKRSLFSQACHVHGLNVDKDIVCMEIEVYFCMKNSHGTACTSS
jgi:transposase